MITLRMFTEADLAYFNSDKSPTDVWNYFGMRGSQGVRTRFAATGLVDADGGMLVVEVDGELAGDVSWRAIRYGPPHIPAAFNIGISLRPEHRGHGVGTTAQRRLVDYLFATYAVHRLEAGTDVENLAEQHALAKAGFRREGVLRGAQFRAGRYRDLVVYSRLRDDVAPDDPDPAAAP